MTDGNAATTPTLDLLADGVAAFAAAPNVPALALALAQRLVRAAPADQAAVWLVEPGGAARLTRVAVWPENQAVTVADALALADAPGAAEALRRGAALRVRLSAGPAALGTDGRCDDLVWVIPLIAGAHYVGVAYLASRTSAPDATTSRVLTLLGTQAALAALALLGPLAVRREDAEFLAVVAHDLKNVATSIKGYTQLLGRHLPADIAPRADRWTGIVEQQVGVLTSTLSALVDLGRLHCGRVALERQPVDLRQLVEAVLADLPPVDAPPFRLHQPPLAVLGTWDAARLERALGAALDSLRRAAPPETDSLPIVVATEGDQARLCVGAPPPHEPWPAEDEWATGAEATLYLLRGVVETHGGSASYRLTADGHPLLQVVLPLHPSAP